MDQDVLLEQRYAPGDDIGYAESILPALRDPRYIRVDGRPLLMVYRPSRPAGCKGLGLELAKLFQSAGRRRSLYRDGAI